MATKIAWLSLLSALNRLSMSFNQIVLPLFVLSIGSDEAFYGLIVAMAGYMQSFVVFPAGAFSDRKGRGPAILIGGLFSGYIILLIPFAQGLTSILILYALTGIGSGFRMSSVHALIADATKSGDERTQSYGYTTAIATLVAVAGPFIGGFILIAYGLTKRRDTRFCPNCKSKLGKFPSDINACPYCGHILVPRKTVE